MKLGEIKLEALMLMYPSISIPYNADDTESITEAVFNLKADTSLGELLTASVGAINRALFQLESRGLTNEAKAYLSNGALGNRRGDVLVSLDKMLTDYLAIKGLFAVCDGEVSECEYKAVSSGDIIFNMNPSCSYLVVYKQAFQRITQITGDGYELSLPRELEPAILYATAAELLADEDAEKSNLFKKELDEIAMRYESSGGSAPQVACKYCI